MGMLNNQFPAVEKAIKEFRKKLNGYENTVGQFDVDLEVTAFTHGYQEDREADRLLTDSLLNRKVTITFNLYAEDDNDE